MFSPKISTNANGDPPARHFWHRLRPGIFARVYAFDLLVAAFAVAACAAVTHYLIESKLKIQVHSLARWIVYEAFAVEDPSARQQLLLRLYRHGNVRMTLYDAGGRLLGAGGPVFPLPDAAHLALVTRLGEEGFTGEEAKLSVAVYSGSSLLGYGFLSPMESFSIGFGLVHALLVLGVIALIAWPLAVSLLKPVRALSEAMQGFTAGDLNVRVPDPGSDEIGELSKGFNRLAARIQELLQSEKMLLAAVSHELRTPLQRVRLALELATDDESAPAAGEPRRAGSRHLASIAADLNELDELLSEILVVARLDPARPASGGLLTRQPLPPGELIAECVERFEAAHPERSLHWLEGPPLPLCEMDARFVRRAVLELLENAARYSPTGEPVEIGALATSGKLVIWVRDHGSGIAPTLHSRIFEPFFQGDPARGGSSGSGLGLAIVQRIAEAHGGSAGLESGPAGSTFRIELPCGPVTAG